MADAEVVAVLAAQTPRNPGTKIEDSDSDRFGMQESPPTVGITKGGDGSLIDDGVAVDPAGRQQGALPSNIGGTSVQVADIDPPPPYEWYGEGMPRQEARVMRMPVGPRVNVSVQTSTTIRCGNACVQS